VSLMMLDIDGLHAINEALGFAGGDAAIRQVARRLLANLRCVDRVARLDGGEFAIVMPATSCEQSRAVAARIHPLVGAEDAVALTISVGVATHARGAEGAERALVQGAAEAMRDAKSRGRNVVVVADPSGARSISAAGS